jgi:hypothetical protein
VSDAASKGEDMTRMGRIGGVEAEAAPEGSKMTLHKK